MHKLLKQEYGELHWWPAETVDQVILGAILTQNTSWNNVRLAMNNLSKAKLDSIDAIASLPVEEIKKYIKPAGFFNQKSVYLKEICTQIRKEGGISRLEKMSDKDIEAFLIKIKGVGKETMQDIMLYAFKRNVFVVDKYTERLFSRIGIIKPGMKEAHRLGKEIENSMSLEDLNNFHGEIVEISKSICKARPECGVCFLRNNCSYEKDFTEP